MTKKVIELKDEKLYIKSYRVRQATKGRRSVQTTIPIEAFELEARRHKMTFEKAIEKLRAVWRFNELKGLHLSFELQPLNEEARP